MMITVVTARTKYGTKYWASQSREYAIEKIWHIIASDFNGMPREKAEARANELTSQLRSTNSCTERTRRGQCVWQLVDCEVVG